MICRDYLGIPVHMSKCTATKASLWGSYMICPQYDCDEDVLVELLGWEPCPRTCTEVTKNGKEAILIMQRGQCNTLCCVGTIVPDHVVRNWNCKANTNFNSIGDKSCQPLVEKLGLEMTRECPLKPCRDYRFEPSNWKRCDCTEWTQKRRYLCNHDHEPRAKDPMKACQNFGLKLMDTYRRCLPRYKCNSIATVRSTNKLSYQPFDYCGSCSCSSESLVC